MSNSLGHTATGRPTVIDTLVDRALSIYARREFILLAAAVGFVFAHWIVVNLPALEHQSPAQRMFAELFDLNRENNIPTWFSSALWQLAALSAYLLSKLDPGQTGRLPNRSFWMVLACVAVFLSLDEVAKIHEGIGGFVDAYGTRLPVYTWVPFGIAAFAAVALYFARFVLKLPRDIGASIILSGAVFMAGAVGFESLGALVDRGVLRDFPLGLTWGKAIALEEFFEMTGVILLITTLAAHRQRLSVLR